MPFKITVPSLPPVEFSPNWRGHWSARSRAGNKAHDDIIALVKEQGWDGKALSGVTISVSWGVKDKRRRDTDNFAARTKPYIDALVLAGVLEDDSRFHVLFQFSWHEANQSEPVITVT